MSYQNVTRIFISTGVIVLLFLSMLASVQIAFAQDGNPPPDPAPTVEVPAEVPVDEEQSEPAEEDQVAEEDDAAPDGEAETEELAPEVPIEEEAPEVEQPATEDAGSDVDDGEDQPGDEPQGAAEQSALEETEAGEAEPSELEETEADEAENPVTEAVQALDEADAVLLDEEGEPLAMATQEAAEVLAAPDPQFCKAGLSYGDPGCGTSHPNMALAIADALAEAATTNTSGTIFVDAGSFSGFTLSGFTFGTSLVIQGNANNGGTTNFLSAVLVDNSNTGLTLSFNDVTFDAGVSVDGVTGDLSFNDVVANAASGDAISVSNHDGAVSLDMVTANNTGSASEGADINNTASSTDADVTITNSNLNGFVNNGLLVQSDGKITVTDTVASGNGERGLDLDNSSSSGAASIVIDTVTANNNQYAGLEIMSAGNITLNHVAANGNWDQGAVLDNTSGTGPNTIKVLGSQFNNNGINGTFSGLVVNSTGSILLNGVTADGNTGDGVTLNSGIGTGPENIAIKCSALTNNGGNGFTADANTGNLGLYSVSTGGNSNAFAITNVTNTTFGVINCSPGDGGDGDGVKHPRDGKNVECNPDSPTTLELELYAHSITFPPMDISGCKGFARSLFNNAELPDELPEDSEFLRGLSIQLDGCEIPEGKAMTIGFEIPATELENEFAVLFWDKESGTWIEIPGMLTEEGRYTVNWPQTGNFVLVTK